jgi:hypothetical protein
MIGGQDFDSVDTFVETVDHKLPARPIGERPEIARCPHDGHGARVDAAFDRAQARRQLYRQALTLLVEGRESISSRLVRSQVLGARLVIVPEVEKSLSPSNNGSAP